MLLFSWVKRDPDGTDFPLQLSQDILADTSFALLCLVLVLGPVARFVPRVRRVVPWGRELGIAMFVTAGLHVVMLLGWSWDGLRHFFGSDGYFDGDTVGTAANWVGLVALGYALVLAATSNKISQRRLGRGWKFVQRQAYTLFVLTWLHTAGWILIDGHGQSFIPWFWGFTLMAVVAQFSGFIHTVRSSRGPSPQRAPAKTRAQTSTAAVAAVGKEVAVTALWVGLIVTVYLMGI
jgi:DMSO/TMAO reductase YedYZ heme-binding membrane subunit